MGKRHTRLTTPMVRRGGALQPASWDEALERAATGYEAVMADHPGSAYGMFSCSKATNELNFITQKFMRAAVGSNNIDSCNRT